MGTHRSQTAVRAAVGRVSTPLAPVHAPGHVLVAVRTSDSCGLPLDVLTNFRGATVERNLKARLTKGVKHFSICAKFGNEEPHQL